MEAGVHPQDLAFHVWGMPYLCRTGSLSQHGSPWLDDEGASGPLDSSEAQLQDGSGAFYVLSASHFYKYHNINFVLARPSNKAANFLYRPRKYYL